VRPISTLTDASFANLLATLLRGFHVFLHDSYRAGCPVLVAFVATGLVFHELNARRVAQPLFLISLISPAERIPHPFDSAQSRLLAGAVFVPSR